MSVIHAAVPTALLTWMPGSLGRMPRRRESAAGEHPGLRAKSATILLGSAGGMGVALLLTPVLTRLYTTETYGMFATVTAVVSVVVAMSTLRLEVAAAALADRARSDQVLAASVWAAMVFGAVCLVVAAVVVAVAGVSPWWLMVGPLVVLASWQLTGSARLSRDHLSARLARQTFLQGAGTPLIQVVAGAVSPTAGGLLLGFGGSRLGWLRAIPWVGPRRAASAMSGLRRYAVIATTSAGVNSLAGQVPVLAAGAVYGAGGAAVVAMTFRLLVTPLGLVGQSVALAALGEVGGALHERPHQVRGILTAGMRDLLVLGIFPCVVAAVAAPFVAGLVLGAEWASTGTAISALAPGALAQFVVAPFSQVLNLTRSNRALLGWDVSRLAVVCAAVGLPTVFGGGLLVSLVALSAGQVLLYAVLAVLCLRAVRPQGAAAVDR
ncbi:hypothetical protein ASG78_03615 [Nostocoides sp. Soil756]|jgi:O-antigen/teichoic acid export membrane protein|nr:hypothetical protein ASG78_03615 [Tetrasphaera sp. Soil756]